MLNWDNITKWRKLYNDPQVQEILDVELEKLHYSDIQINFNTNILDKNLMIQIQNTWSKIYDSMNLDDSKIIDKFYIDGIIEFTYLLLGDKYHITNIDPLICVYLGSSKVTATSGLYDCINEIHLSHLNYSIRSFNQLKCIEDSMVVRNNIYNKIHPDLYCISDMSLDDVYNLEYFSDKLTRSLKITDERASKYLIRFSIVLKDLLRIYLIGENIITKDDWKIIENIIEFKFIKNNNSDNIIFKNKAIINVHIKDIDKIWKKYLESDMYNIELDLTEFEINKNIIEEK